MMNDYTDAHDPDALRNAIIDFCLSHGSDMMPASANLLDRHDRRIFLNMRDQIKSDIENATP